MGALWLMASVASASADVFNGRAAVTDMLAFALIALTVRRPNLGAVLMTLLLIVSDFISDYQHGFLGVLSYVAVVALIRLGKFWQAVVLTALTFAFGLHLSLMHDMAAPSAAVFGWLLAAGISWAIGVGFHGYGAVAEMRQQENLHRGLLELAWDLHDFVARDLTIIAMQADLGVAKGGASPEELQAIADHARSANQFLRQTQQRFQTTTVDTGSRAITIESAVSAGAKELAANGRRLAVSGELYEHPRSIDAVGGRVLMEALHNATKHGRGTVELRIDDTETSLNLVVTNKVNKKTSTSAGIGQLAMMERVATVGGKLRSEMEGERWVMRLELPLPDARGKEPTDDPSGAV